MVLFYFIYSAIYPSISSACNAMHQLSMSFFSLKIACFLGMHGCMIGTASMRKINLINSICEQSNCLVLEFLSLT